MQSALFDAIEPELAVSGGSGGRYSPKSELYEAESGTRSLGEHPFGFRADVSDPPPSTS